MTTEFINPEEAIRVAVSQCGASTDQLKEVEDVNATGVFTTTLLKSPEAPEKIKQQIRQKIDAQRAFKLEREEETILIVVGPFRDGFDCYIMSAETGMGFRL